MRRTSKEEDVVELSQGKSVHAANREVPPVVDGNGLPADPPALAEEPQAPVDSALLFQDWTIKRAERRVRRLFVALVLVGLAAGGWLFYLQTQLNDLSAAPSRSQTAAPPEDVGLRQTLFGSEGPPEAADVIGRLEQDIVDVKRSMVDARRDGSRLGRCLSEQLREFDRNLRRLIERKITGTQYLREPRIRACP